MTDDDRSGGFLGEVAGRLTALSYGFMGLILGTGFGFLLWKFQELFIRLLTWALTVPHGDVGHIFIYCLLRLFVLGSLAGIAGLAVYCIYGGLKFLFYVIAPSPKSKRGGDQFGTSRLATEKELETATSAASPDGVYLGSYKTAEGKIRDPVTYRGKGHVTTFGPVGRGKTTRLLVPNVATMRRSLFITDPKGELAAITARARAKLGPVYVLNPFGLFTDDRPYMKSCGHNPLAALAPTSRDFVDDCMGYAEALIKVEGKEPHFSQSAQDLWAGLTMHACLMRDKYKDEGSFARVRTMLTAPYIEPKKGEELSGLALTIAEMEDSDFSPVRAKAGRFKNMTNEMAGVISTAITQTRFLDSPSIADDIAGHSIDFAKMKDEITTIYLVLPLDRLETHANWLRVMVTSALRQLMRTPPGKFDVMFVLEEAAQLGYLQDIKTALSAGRGPGVFIWSILQSAIQLRDIYGEGWENFVGQSNVLNAFAPQDWFTAEYLSQISGQKTEQMKSKSASDQGSSTSTSDHGFPLFRPEDLMRLDSGTLLNRVDGAKFPFLTAAPPYFDATFANTLPRLDLNPYAR